MISFLVEPPSFVRKLENLSSLVGSEVSLQCTLKGTEPMTVYWMKDNHELKEAEHIQITYGNKTALLCITDLQSKHAGKYSCQAQNPAGSQTCSAVLTVKGWLGRKMNQLYSDMYRHRAFSQTVTSGPDKVFNQKDLRLNNELTS